MRRGRGREQGLWPEARWPVSAHSLCPWRPWKPVRPVLRSSRLRKAPAGPTWPGRSGCRQHVERLVPEVVANQGLATLEATCAGASGCLRVRHGDVTEPRRDDLLEGLGALGQEEWTGGCDLRLGTGRALVG